VSGITFIVGCKRLLHGDCLHLVLACVDHFKAWSLQWMVSGVISIVLGWDRLLRGDRSLLVLACMDDFNA
jgi:hypothetical protein